MRTRQLSSETRNSGDHTILTTDTDNLILTSGNHTYGRARRTRDPDHQEGVLTESIPRKKIPTNRNSHISSECVITKVVPRTSAAQGLTFTATAKPRKVLPIPDSTNGRYDTRPITLSSQQLVWVYGLIDLFVKGKWLVYTKMQVIIHE